MFTIKKQTEVPDFNELFEQVKSGSVEAKREICTHINNLVAGQSLGYSLEEIERAYITTDLGSQDNMSFGAMLLEAKESLEE